MQTSLPDLPLTDYGNAILDPDFHSSSRATPRTYPRTDLRSLRPWTSFENDIHQAIQSATACANLPINTPFSLNRSPRDREVRTEEEIRAHGQFELHEPVKVVMQKLGVKGRLVPTSGSIPIVGEPDFSWVEGGKRPHPKLIVEYKTWWGADLKEIPAAFQGTRDDLLSKQSLEALQQIYGYMTFNNNKFGILTNWKRALFLRRVKIPGRQTLEYYLLELGGRISMLKAWVGMILLAEDDWFYDSAPPSRHFGSSVIALKERKTAIHNTEKYNMAPVNGKYECLTLDFRLCGFDLSSARHRVQGCIVNGRLQQESDDAGDFHVICKVIDVSRYPDAVDTLEHEADAYAALQELQGKVIPKLYGYYEVWGILRLLALQPVGTAIPEDVPIDRALRKKMREAVQCIHQAGYVHGDVARRNFCRTVGGEVFLVDLERCRQAQNPSELLAEMNEIDNL